MEAIMEVVHANAAYAPFIIFGLLVLAGFNLPVSEDAMIFLSAYLAVTHPEYLVQLFIAVYLGAYVSDLICFWLGWHFGPRLWNIKFFASMIAAEKVDRIRAFYERYGFWTLIVGRFIPFGVRNGLFLTAGLGRMRPLRFAVADWIACSISVSIFFSLYYRYGLDVVDLVKRGNMIIFAVAISAVILWFARKRFQRKRHFA